MEQCFVAIWGLVSTKAVMQEHLFLEMLYKTTFRQSLCVIYDKRSARTNRLPGAGHSQWRGLPSHSYLSTLPFEKKIVGGGGRLQEQPAVNHDLDIHLLPLFYIIILFSTSSNSWYRNLKSHSCPKSTNIQDSHWLVELTAKSCQLYLSVL